MESAEGLWSKAVELAFSHQYQEALDNIDKALAMSPDSSKYAIEKAEILCEQGKIQEALSFLEEGKFMPQDQIIKEIQKINEVILWDKNLINNKQEHDKLTRLMKWANDNGMNTNNMRIAYYGVDFRGVHANRRIRAGERIITANSKFLVIVPKILEASPLAKKVASCGIELDYPFATALACMIYEAKSNPNTWWQPYLESFPETAETFPYFFNEKEKSFLSGTIWESNMYFEMKASESEYDKIRAKIPEFKEMTAEVYLKLTTLVCSRYFGAEELPDQKLAVPVIDMFNYYVDKVGQTSWQYFSEEDTFAVTALKDIHWGEMIALNYGSKSNGRYLLYYGFIPDNNSYIYISIDSSISNNDPLLKQKQELLGYYNDERFLCSREFYLDWEDYFEENNSVLSLCRFAVYKDDISKLKDYLSKFDIEVRYKQFVLPPLSKKNELAALDLLKKVVIEKSNKYPNTLEEDEMILNGDKGLTLNGKNALTVRIGELRAHKKIIEFADKMIELLNNPTKAKTEIETMNTWYKEYAHKSLLPLLTPF